MKIKAVIIGFWTAPIYCELILGSFEWASRWFGNSLTHLWDHNTFSFHPSVKDDSWMTYTHDIWYVIRYVIYADLMTYKPGWHIFICHTATLKAGVEWHIRMTYTSRDDIPNDIWDDVSPWHMHQMTYAMTYDIFSTLGWHIRYSWILTRHAVDLYVMPWYVMGICHGDMSLYMSLNHIEYVMRICHYYMSSLHVMCICHAYMSWVCIMRNTVDRLFNMTYMIYPMTYRMSYTITYHMMYLMTYTIRNIYMSLNTS